MVTSGMLGTGIVLGLKWSRRTEATNGSRFGPRPGFPGRAGRRGLRLVPARAEPPGERQPGGRDPGSGARGGGGAEFTERTGGAGPRAVRGEEVRRGRRELPYDRRGRPGGGLRAVRPGAGPDANRSGRRGRRTPGAGV